MLKSFNNYNLFLFHKNKIKHNFKHFVNLISYLIIYSFNSIVKIYVLIITYKKKTLEHYLHQKFKMGYI